MPAQPTWWDWTRACFFYAWMWLKALPILYLPFFSLLVTDDDAFKREMNNDVATLKRLLHQE
jgi:hypothetical protein